MPGCLFVRVLCVCLCLFGFDRHARTLFVAQVCTACTEYRSLQSDCTITERGINTERKGCLCVGVGSVRKGV